MKTNEYRSEEETKFALWLDEAQKEGVVLNWAYEENTVLVTKELNFPQPKKLKTKIKHGEKKIQNTSYTPDFCIAINPAYAHALTPAFPKALWFGAPKDQEKGNLLPQSILLCDVKGTFDFYQKDSRYFSLIQKVIAERAGIWVEKITIPSFFLKAWLPEELRWMKNRKKPTLTKAGKSCLSFSQWVERNRWKIDGLVF